MHLLPPLSAKSRLRLATLLAFGASLSGAQAEVIYAQTFDSDPGYVQAAGPNANNISSISYGGGNSGLPKITTGQFSGTAQYQATAAIPGSIDKGSFVIGSDAKINGKSRNRSYATFIDTAKQSIGQYQVQFDVSDFLSADSPNTALYLHIYEGSSTIKGHVKFQLTQQATLPKTVATSPLVTTAMGAKNWQVLMDNPVHGNGRYTLRFGLVSAGKPGDYLALVWSQVKQRGSTAVPSMTIDNLEVSKLPAQQTAANPTAKSPQPVGQDGDWKLQSAFSDEFDGPSVDPGKWNNNPASWGAWSWDDKNTAQKDGTLELRMVHEPHVRNSRKLFYKSGILRSHRQRTYGYYEARIKGCPLFPGACPAFWIYSDGRNYSGEVRYCEIDFAELQMNELDRESGERHPANHIEMNLHLRMAGADGKIEWRRPNSHPELCASSWSAPWDPRDDFHIYGCDVTPDTITWFIDGKQVAQKPNLHWHQPMNVTLSLGLRHPHIGWVGQEMQPIPNRATTEGFPTAMAVDYVRVWERR